MGRTAAKGFAMPQLDVTPSEVEGFKQAWQELHVERLFQDRSSLRDLCAVLSRPTVLRTKETQQLLNEIIGASLRSTREDLERETPLV